MLRYDLDHQIKGYNQTRKIDSVSQSQSQVYDICTSSITSIVIKHGITPMHSLAHLTTLWIIYGSKVCIGHSIKKLAFDIA